MGVWRRLLAAELLAVVAANGPEVAASSCGVPGQDPETCAAGLTDGAQKPSSDHLMLQVGKNVGRNRLEDFRCTGMPDAQFACSDNGCKVLADHMQDKTCRWYCDRSNLDCVGAWEEQNEDCNVKATLTCDQTYPGTSDLLCECGPRGGWVPPAQAPAPTGQTLVWSDEFDGGSLDTSKWSIFVGGGGFGNRELQFYTASNLQVQGGSLRITAQCQDYGSEHFTSAKLSTQHRQDWGPGHRVEVRARLPTARGTWPAIWMLSTENSFGPWPNSGEIDITEAVGCNGNKVYGTIHTEAYNHLRHTERQGSIVLSVAAWHTYVLEWEESQLRWYADGIRFSTFDRTDRWQEWPFHKNFFLILNLAVGGDWGGWCLPGHVPSCDSEFAAPQVMEVDYVRVYSMPPAALSQTS